MASISEWINYFRRLKKREKVKIILEILGILVALLAANYYFNINIGSSQLNIQNNSGTNQITVIDSSLTNSPIIQDSSNISVMYNTEDTFGLDYDQYPRIHTLKFHPEFTNHYVGGNANFYSIKVIVPDKKEAFLDEILFNKEYTISRCNMELTDCIINPRFIPKKDLTEEQICWIFISRFSDKNLTMDKLIPAKKYQIDPNKCFRYVK